MKISAVGLIFLACLAVTSYGFSSHKLQSRGPCNFKDTINITDGYKDENNSYVHNGIIYAPGTYDLYSYIIENQTEMVPVKEHYRGCICKYKLCIRLCCLEGVGINGNHPSCVKNNILHVPNEENEERTIDIESHEYGILVDRPCAQMYVLEPLDYSDDQWHFVKVRLF